MGNRKKAQVKAGERAPTNRISRIWRLRAQTWLIADGDLRPLESMQYGQAVVLQTVFTDLARRAASQEYLKQFK
jgi:hypothetical protein